ncbi:CTL-like protein 2 [Trichogramma pretiosum]|uniref:CTL-like protein 2 n=1 Tax=Trichogramma pretiosum TaxID=7493 RepID=UPI0006C94D5C|nr:CTL-like protein 2 [Trichogramma pretiosum]
MGGIMGGTMGTQSSALPFGANRISDYGTKISYDPTWEGPLKAKRTAENIPFAIAYYLFVALWVGIAVYALVNGDADKYSDFYRTSEDFVLKQGWTLAVIVPLAAFLSILYLFLLRIAAKPVVYTSIALLFIMLFANVIHQSYLLYCKHSHVHITGFISSIVVFIILVVIFVRKHKFIPMTCEIVREASKVILAFPLMLFFSLVHSMLIAAFFIFDLSLFFWIESIASEDHYPAYLPFFHLVNALALIWIFCHLHAFFVVCASGAYGTWYWTMDKKEVPFFTTLRFIYITFRLYDFAKSGYHIGPTAFGSLIITVCTILNLLIEQVSPTNAAVDGTADLGSAGLACCNAAMYCIRVLVEAVTGMAYIRIGHHGTGLIDAGREALTLFRRNYLKVAVINAIVFVLAYFLIFAIFIGSLLLFWGLLRLSSVDVEQIIYLFVVLAICLFIVIWSIVKLLHTAVDNIFLCMLEDYEMNGGSQRPYHMSNKLKELVLENRLE